MRRPDKPGTSRVSPRNGRFLVSGVTTDGERVKVYAATKDKAESLRTSIFGSTPEATGSIGPIPSVAVAPQLDDWGFPVKVSPEVAASINASFGIKPAPTTVVPTTPPTVNAKEEQEKKDRRAKHAKSLMELAGVGWAAGTVMVSKKWVDASGRDPVKVNPRQINDLADSTRDTLIEWFGDRDIKPWHMMLILTLGIPMSMYLQSPKKPEEKPENKLRSVP